MNHVFPVVVEGSRLKLRELAAGDHPALCRLWGDSVIARHMAFSAMTPGEVDQAITEAQAETRRRPRTDYTLGAASIADNVLVGTIRMTSAAERSVYCGRLTVRRDLHNQGYASEIVELSSRFCFTVLKAHRVWGAAHEDNRAARQVLLNARMTFEGCIRDFFYARGAWHTVASYSILEDEWRRCHSPG
jgi:[ribosomal protein S5]-alanine N-acetyltransferase